MTATGLSVPFTDHGLAAQGDEYARLHDAGYTDFWSLEATGWDAFTPLVLAALRVPSARFGTGIVPAFTRGPATLAGHAAAMAELVGDRFTLGIGASTKAIVESWNGIDYADPYHRTQDTVRFLRRALAGEKVTDDFRTFSVKGFRLERPPAHPPRLMVAALREGMLRMASRESDGVVLSWLAVEDVPRITAVVGSGKDVVARLFVLPSTDRHEVLSIGRRQIAWYASTPAYRAFLEWLGRGDELALMWERWDCGDRSGAVDAIPESVVDDLIVSGDRDQCLEHIERYRAAGIDLPLVHVIPSGTSSFEAALSIAPGLT